MKDDIKLPPLPEWSKMDDLGGLVPSEIRQALAMYAREAIKADRQRRSDPVAWHTEDHLTDKSATTYDPVVAERWIEKGWPVTPLFYAPQSDYQQILVNEQERAEFEAWASTKWPGATLSTYQNNCGITIPERYKHPKLQAAWEAYQAGLAAMFTQRENQE